MSSQSSLNLLDLPAEVLTQILLPFLLPGAQEPISIVTTRPHPFCSIDCSILPVLLIHPRIYNIAVPLLYGPSNEFVLDLTGSNHVYVRRQFEQIAEEQGNVAKSGNHYDQYYGDGGADNGDHLNYTRPGRANSLLHNQDVLRRVSRLTLRLDRIRGWISTSVIPLLEDMILRGKLTYLDIILKSKGRGDESLLKGAVLELQQQQRSLARKDMDLVYQQHQDDGGVKATSRESIMIELLALLTDPYVRQGRLFVSSAQNRKTGTSHDGDTDGEDLHELDWRAMMAEKAQV